MKSLPTLALIFLFSLIVATAVGWRVAEYSLVSSRGDAFVVMGAIFVGLFGLLSLIYFLVWR